jgi:cell cycle checkpoint protein
MTVTVEEARSLLGIAFIFSEVFDEYTYHPEPPRAARPPKSEPSQTDPNASQTEEDNAAFEIPLNTLIECLNIFGTAGAINAMAAISGAGGASSNSKQAKKWRRAGDGDSDGEGRVGLEAYFGPNAGEKRTGMRLSYLGAGYPLTLIMYGLLVSSSDLDLILDRAEDAAGPTTTCEITTFDPEPQLELHYDSDQTYVFLSSSV